MIPRSASRRDGSVPDGKSCLNLAAARLRHRVGPDIRLAFCWAHARRKLVEITRTGRAPIAEEGVKRIGELYRIEAESPEPGGQPEIHEHDPAIRGSNPRSRRHMTKSAKDI